MVQTKKEEVMKRKRPEPLVRPTKTALTWSGCEAATKSRYAGCRVASGSHLAFTFYLLIIGTSDASNSLICYRIYFKKISLCNKNTPSLSIACRISVNFAWKNASELPP